MGSCEYGDDSLDSTKGREFPDYQRLIVSCGVSCIIMNRLKKILWHNYCCCCCCFFF